jgi:CRISPR-associated protein (TIGR03984 family)
VTETTNSDRAGARDTALRAVRSPREVDPLEALRWWTTRTDPDGHESVSNGPGSKTIGFVLCPEAAFWWRWQDGCPRDRRGNSLEGPWDLTAAFELVAFDGVRELRWLHSQEGRGRAVVLTEDPQALPVGDPVVFDTGPRRVGAPYRRILAGSLSDVGRGWARLRAARYRDADIPVSLPTANAGDSPVAVLTGVEYAVEDEHGNLTVVDSRLTGLEILSCDEVKFDFRNSPEEQA